MKQQNHYNQALAYLHYRQSQAAERMGRDFIAYRLGQVKSHINNFYFKNNQRT